MGLNWVIQNAAFEKCFDPAEEPGAHKIVGELMHLRHDLMHALWSDIEISEASKRDDGDLELLVLRYVVRLLLFILPLISWIDLGLQTGGRAACTVVKDVILAIPCDLAASRFSRLNRLWYLRPADPEVKDLWRLHGKGIFLGCSALKDVEPFVSLARKQMLIA